MIEKLVKRRGNVFKYYILKICTWNFFLNRYYPKAELILERVRYN